MTVNPKLSYEDFMFRFDKLFPGGIAHAVKEEKLGKMFVLGFHSGVVSARNAFVRDSFKDDKTVLSWPELWARLLEDKNYYRDFCFGSSSVIAPQDDIFIAGFSFVERVAKNVFDEYLEECKQVEQVNSLK